jgi:hypothetical protein
MVQQGVYLYLVSHLFLAVMSQQLSSHYSEPVLVVSCASLYFSFTALDIADPSSGPSFTAPRSTRTFEALNPEHLLPIQHRAQLDINCDPTTAVNRPSRYTSTSAITLLHDQHRAHLRFSPRRTFSIATQHSRELNASIPPAP